MDKKLRLSLIFQAAGNAVGFLRGVQDASGKTGRALGAARQKLDQLQASARDVAGMRKLSSQLGDTRTKLAAAQTEAQRLGRAHAAADKPTRQLTAALKTARTRVNELKDAEQRQALALQTVSRRMDAAGLSAKNLSGSEARLARETREANRELKRQQDRLEAVADRQRRMRAARGRYDRTQQLAGTIQGAGQSSAAAGVVVAAPLVLASRAAMTFEDGMADVRKVVDFDTPQQFRQMSSDILDLSTRLPVATEGLTAIVAAAGQAGIARNELIGFAEDAAKMGIAFDTTADDAGAKMATWRTAFRMTQPEVSELADQINYLGNTGPANALAISNIVTRIGPLGEVAGLAAGEIAALGSTIAGMGVEEEIAATGIKNTMLALTRGEAATKKQQAAFSALGLEAGAVARSMQRDAGGTIVDVMSRIGGMSPERQSAILTQLFGSESVAAIAPLLTNLDLLRTNLGKVGDETLYAGSMQREYESRAATTSNAVQLVGQGFKAVAIEIGTGFLPHIQAASKWLGDAAGKVRRFTAAHPNLVKVLGAVVGVLAAALLLFGGLAMVVAAVLGPFALLQLSLTGTGLLFGPVIAGLTGTGVAAGGAAIGVNALLWPVLLVIAAVAALAAGAYLIYKNWGTIGPWLGKLWDGVRSVVGGAFDYLKNIFLTFTPLGLVIRNWSAIVDFLRTLWTAAKELVGLALDSIVYLLMRWSVLGVIVRNWSAITGFLSGIWSRVRGIISAGIEAAKGVIAGFAPLNMIRTALNNALSGLADMPGRFLKLGTDMIGGLINGIRRRRAAVQAASRDAAGAAESAARERLDTHSPSRVFAAIGGDVMAGFSAGIQRGTTGPQQRMRAAAAAIAAAGAFAVPGLAYAAGQGGIQPSFTPGLQLPSGAASSAAGQGGGAGTSAGAGSGPISIQIHIHAAPGMSEEKIADQVMQRLGALNLGRLGDGADSWGAD